MNEGLEARLREFAEALLIRAGALVEWPPTAEEGLAVLSPQTAARLGCPETLALTHRPEAEGLCVNLAADFLDRVGPLLEAEPRAGLFQLAELPIKKGALAETIARTFAWHNAKVVVRNAGMMRVEYHTWYFLASVASEDCWEDVIPATANAVSGAVVAMPDPLTSPNLEPRRGTAPAAPSTYPAVVRRVAALVEQRATPFVSRMEERRERDRARLRDYYGALLREESTRKHRVWTPEVKEKSEAKRRAVQLELDRKLVELDERYALRVELAPLALFRVQVQVLAVQCDVYRKQAQRVHTLYWNPVLRELEPMACDACGAGTFSVIFTDADVRPLCAACAK